MTKTLQQNASFLKLLLKPVSNQQKKALLQTASSCQVKALGEIVRNLLHGSITLSKHQLTKLRRHKTTLRRIDAASLNKKKGLLTKNLTAITTALSAAEPFLKKIL